MCWIGPEAREQPMPGNVQSRSPPVEGHQPPAICSRKLKFLDIGAGNLIGPCEVFRVDEHPKESEQNRKNRNEIAKPTNACLPGIEWLLFSIHHGEVLTFHAGCLAAAQHKEKEIDSDESEVTKTIDSNLPPIRREVFRHFEGGRNHKHHVNRSNDCEIDKPGYDPGDHQVSLIFREGEEW